MRDPGITTPASPAALADVPLSPPVAALPKADLHIHAETDARLDRVLAAREGRAPFDWPAWAARLIAETPAGMPRLMRLGADGGRVLPRETVEALDAAPELFVARVADLLAEGASNGAVLVEVIFGAETIMLPDFMTLFREAERQVRERFPHLRAEALIAATKPGEERWIEQLLPACIAAARDGLAGLHIIPHPYDAEADWTPIYRWVERAADAGLGLAAHAGEFSAANIAAALDVPGLTRIGHAVHAARDPWLLEKLARSGATVECSLSCNVVLGAVETYEDYPIREMMAAGIPVTLSSDDPVRVATTIGREYAVAAALGFTPEELLAFTENGVRASFAAPGRKAEIMQAMRDRPPPAD